MKAFTLVELLWTAGILGFALSLVLMLFINTTKLNEASRNLTTATIHGEYVLESIKNTSFTSIATDITANDWTWNKAGITSQGLTALNAESITTAYSGSNPLTVTVTVSWQNTQGRSQSKTLSTLISG